MMTGLGVVYQIGIWERRLIRGMHWPSEHGLKAVSCCKESRVSRLSRSGCYKACPFSWSGDGTGSQGTTIWIWQTNGEAEPLYSQKRGGFSSPLGTTTPEATIAGLLSRPLLNKSTCLLVPQVSLWCKNRTENDRPPFITTLARWYSQMHGYVRRSEYCGTMSVAQWYTPRDVYLFVQVQGHGSCIDGVDMRLRNVPRQKYNWQKYDRYRILPTPALLLPVGKIRSTWIALSH